MESLLLLVSLSVCYAAPPVFLAPIRNPDDIGASVQFKNQDPIGNYNFGYNEAHPSGGSFRRESGDAYGNVAGSYGLRDADGRLRIVSYVADANGFRAKVDSNEPGVEPQDPASASFNKPAILPVQPVPPPQIVPLLPPPRVAPQLLSTPVGIVPPPYPAKYPVAIPVGPPPPPASFPVPLPAVPPPPGFAVPLPKANGPYVNPPPLPFRGLPFALEYYRAPYLNRIIPSPLTRPGLIPLTPQSFNVLPYVATNKKPFPTYQPLGLS